MRSSLICALITLLSVYSAYYFNCFFILTGCASVCFLIAGIVLKLKLKLKNYTFTIFIICAGFAIGTLCSFNIYIRNKSSFTSIPLNKITEYSGEIIEDSYITNKGLAVHKLKLFYITNNSGSITTEASGTVIIFDKNNNFFFTGEIVKIHGSLNINTINPGINYNGDIENIRSFGFSKALYGARSELRIRIENQIDSFGEPYTAFFKGLFLGLKEKIPVTLIDNFKKTGTVHLLAISGLHIGIIYFFIILILSPIPWKSLKWILGSIVILLYLFIVGPRPSLVRASIMLIILGISKQLDRETDLLNILCISIIIFLIIDPFSAFDISFKLSFLAIAGILIPGKIIARQFSQYIPDFLNIPLSYSIGAQIFTLPVILQQYGEFFPSGITATILLIPFITIFLWAGIINLLLINLTVIFYPFRYIYYILYKIIYSITDIFSNFPGIKLQWQNIYYFFYILVFMLFFIYKDRIHENKL